MIELRELTKLGIESFESHLRKLDNSKELIPLNLNVEPFSKELDLQKPVFIDEKKIFDTRMEIGSYLYQKLSIAGIKRETVIVEAPEIWNNVWSWLGSVWMEQFIIKRNDVYNVPAISRFIGSSDWRRFYRHFVATPYYIYSLHEESNSKLFLDCVPWVHNEFMEQIASRQWIITSRPLVELAHILYWNRDTNRPKRGARGKGRGTARRFGKVINQFRLTYDIYRMNTQEILNLLPSEFKEWYDST